MKPHILRLLNIVKIILATHSKGQKCVFGVSVDPKLIEELDAFRGEVPRSRVVERALNQFLEANVKNNLQGPQVSTPVAQAAETATTTTTDEATPTSTSAHLMDTQDVVAEDSLKEGYSANAK